MKFYEFSIPVSINGEQLKTELGCNSVYVCNNKLVICGDLTEAQAASGIASHKPITPLDKTAEKAALLAKLVITADEAKLLLS